MERGGALALADAFYVIVPAQNRDSCLVRIDPSTGASTRLQLPARGTTLGATRRDVLVFSATANQEAPGAYTPGTDGKPARTYRLGDVWTGAAVGDRLMTVGRRNRDNYLLAVSVLSGSDTRW